MKAIKKELIYELMRKSITPQQFLQKTGLTESNICSETYDLLQCAYDEQSASKAEFAVYLIFVFHLFDPAYVKLINQLILCTWHEQHEDLVFILQQLKSPTSIQYLCDLLNIYLDYLDYNNSYALHSKCLWALHAIGDDDAHQALQHATFSSDHRVAELAKEVLQKRLKNRETISCAVKDR